MLWMILEIAEYEPINADAVPTVIIKTHMVTWRRLVFPFKILRKQTQGSIRVTSIVSKDPIKAITKPKKGTARPTTTVEIVNAVLMRIGYTWDLVCFDGNNSSKLIATGDRVKANVHLIKEDNFFLFYKRYHLRKLHLWNETEYKEENLLTEVP